MTPTAHPASLPCSTAKHRQIAQRIFTDVAQMSVDRAGVTRPAYSGLETRVLDYIAERAGELGLKTFVDVAGNLVFTFPDDDGGGPAGYIGSHVDSVPQGGNFDGLAGVVAALLVLHDMRQDAWLGSIPVRGLALRGEESAFFGTACLGSQALLGRLDPKTLTAPHRDGGCDLEAAMASLGIDTTRVREGRPVLDPQAVRFFVELHIEQGPVLVERGWPIAAVTGIRGNIRHRRMSCFGETGHSGAVPRWLRRDAVFAVSELLMRMDDHWATIQQLSGDLVLTVGIIETDPRHHSMSRIPGEVHFSFEARSQEEATLDDTARLLVNECERIERERGVRFEFDDRVIAAPARMDETVVASILEACTAEGLPAKKIPSGAGHDAAIFANAGIPAGMIFVRNEHGSHNPREAMEMDDFLAGVAVLDRTARALSRGTSGG